MRDGQTLAPLLWPADRLGEALHAVTRAAGLQPAAEPSGGPIGDPEAAGPWIEAAALGLGLDAEEVEVPYAEVDELLGRAAPRSCVPPGEPAFSPSSAPAAGASSCSGRTTGGTG